MVRVLIFFAFVFLLALGGAWMADRPGVVTLEWQGYVVQASLLTAVVAFGASIVASIVAWGFFRLIWKSPTLVSHFMQSRRKDKGYDALSQGLLALGSGDTLHARKFGLKADKLLDGNEPAARLLLAQTSQLDGDHAESRRRFEAMLEDDRSMAVGLHGLYIEAERESEPAAARHFAEEAFNLVPGLRWAGNAVLGYQAVSGDWEEAIATLERNYAARMLDKKTLRRQKAVLLTARALELENENPDRARTLAVEAHGLAPSLVPAAIVAARLRTRSGEVRKASKILEATWKLSPHPDLADAYAHVRPGDSVTDRLSRVRTLASMRAYSSEGAIAIAVAAIEAKKFDEARDQLKRVLRSEPTQRAFLLMADLEEREHDDQGRIREWLSRAVRAPSDKVWTADGVVSANWAPVSPKTGRVDAYEWAAPEGAVDQDQLIEVIDDKLFEPPELAAPVQVLKEPVEADIVVPKPQEAEKPAAVKDEPVATPAAMPDAAEPVVVTETAKETSAEKKPDEKAKAEEPRATVVPVESSSWAPTKANEKAEEKVEGPSKTEEEGASSPDEKPEKKDEKLVEFPLSQLPDDPGPEPDDEDPKTPKDQSFRFFR
ncbi:heme biosynthesis HemY N-terminal domain-containing protein [Pseudovibrio sp. Ad37]|uniref:heme biosynthesis HemY N-terminal domain-containing protein n=1 Tax=Pseudovibrio sp. Ad37 TaxID=989422 RepID=UPI0007AE5445|nr:heme biosynthesis HemY N-terminal domain-containing protein [Pseudovibrio sp. Ad37]KZL13613.1 putative protoheme IX biogenesis protein [Pseudovibrio sp. Ad37]